MSYSSVFLVRPKHFSYNTQTAESNKFQQVHDETDTSVSDRAIVEFDGVVEALKENKICCVVADDCDNPINPDAVFPNNWISFHSFGSACRIVLYPMCTLNRRSERRREVIDYVCRIRNLSNINIVDISHYENVDRFLEGTGSFVLDRIHKILYCSLSIRSDEGIAQEVSSLLGYELCSFVGKDKSNFPVYHTNVVMAIANRYAIICLECVSDDAKRAEIRSKLSRPYAQNSSNGDEEEVSREILEISLDQMSNFAGNMLEIINSDGNSVVFMSSTAFASLRADQVAVLQKYSIIQVVSIPTIEKYGGGSVRCMMCEVL